MNTLDCTAAILAGGLGTRLRPVVSDRPKVLAEVGGRCFIEYLFDQLESAGVSSVVLCVGYMADAIRDRLGSCHRRMALRYSEEPHPMGTGGALRMALPLLDSPSILVLNGDSYCDTRLDSFAAWHATRHYSASIMLTTVDDARRYGRVDVDQQERIVRFVEKSEAAGPGLINAGVYLLPREWIGSIAADREVSLERDVFPEWIQRGLHGFVVKEALWDIGIPESYAEAIKSFRPSIDR